MNLYKLDKKGAVRVWMIYQTDEDEFQCEHGVEGGESQIEVFNVVAKARRTLEEQIELEINSKVSKKIANGYSKDRDNLSKIVKNQLGFEKQMKAVLLRDGDRPKVVYDGHTFAQRKYNGLRCTVAAIAGRVVAYSSGGKYIKSIEHILDAISINDGQKLDGELYIHGVSLQKISGMVRKQKEQCEDLKFVCFDSISDDTFAVRYRNIPKQWSKHIIMSETIMVNSFEEVKKLFFKFRAEKYEGLMLRHGEMGYEAGRRSKQIYKIKKLDGEGYYDREFKVIGVVASAEGWAILICSAGKGKRFRVSCHGTHHEKREVLLNIEKYIGRFVKVEFPEYTDAGIPSQPNAIMWREKDE